MQAESEVKASLNGVLETQLTAINQFFLHARMLKNWGLEQLNERDYKQSIKSMKLADDLIARILFLEGLPNLQKLGKLLIGEDVPEILQNDLALQTAAVKQLQEGIVLCEARQDYISRELFEKLLEETEEHIDWIETQQWLIENTGLQNYLQSVM